MSGSLGGSEQEQYDTMSEDNAPTDEPATLPTDDEPHEDTVGESGGEEYSTDAYEAFVQNTMTTDDGPHPTDATEEIDADPHAQAESPTSVSMAMLITTFVELSFRKSFSVFSLF